MPKCYYCPNLARTLGLCPGCYGELADQVRHAGEGHDPNGQLVAGCPVCARLALLSRTSPETRAAVPLSVRTFARINSRLIEREQGLARLRRLQRYLARRIARADLDEKLSRKNPGK